MLNKKFTQKIKDQQLFIFEALQKTKYWGHKIDVKNLRNMQQR